MEKGSIKAKALLLISIIGAFSCLIMVLQGFHLWGTWEPPMFDSSEVANISSKARGRGGIILLIIRIFPQFLVFGFGFWGWQLKPYIRDIRRTKVEIGLSPADEMEEKVLRLEKDPKLKYKARHYKGKEFTNERRNGQFHYYNTDTAELKKAIARLQSRRKAHGLPSLSHELLNLVPADK